MDRSGPPTLTEFGQFAEAAALLAVATLAVAILPFRLLVRTLGRNCGAGLGEGATGVSIRRAVERASRRLPWRVVCIQQALAAQWMLRRRGAPSLLHYGLKQNEGRLSAHVWVTLYGQSVIGEERAEPHARVATFPRCKLGS